MRVGAVAETITVTGETPVVDTQSARRQAVLSDEIINGLPATRTYGALLSAIPGLQVQGNGSAAVTPVHDVVHARNGGRANEGRMMIDGLPVAASFNGGGVSTFTYDIANADEMQVLVSGALGEAENGGPQVNLVPKSGGNTFKGTAFYSGAGRWSTRQQPQRRRCDRLRPARSPPASSARGTSAARAAARSSATAVVLRATCASTARSAPVPGAFANLNAGDATKWTYAKDPNVEVRGADSRAI